MIEDFFDHTCDIYHLVIKSDDRGYGLPEQSTFAYGTTPDISKSKCHFHIMHESTRISQEEPEKKLESRMKLSLPIGTEVKLNDKVVFLETGLAYTAEIPRDIRGNHISVWVHREYPKAL